jgi:hypothetical protein
VLEGRLLIPYSPLPHPAVGVFVFPINSLVAQDGLEFPIHEMGPAAVRLFSNQAIIDVITLFQVSYTEIRMTITDRNAGYAGLKLV